MAYRSRRTGKMREAGAGRRRTVTADVDSRAFKRSVKKAQARIVLASHAQAGRYAFKVRNLATRYTPVDKGILKAGWIVREGEDSRGKHWVVVNPVAYSIHIEFGTEFVAAQPMIRPALAEAAGVQGVGVEKPRPARRVPTKRPT